MVFLTVKQTKNQWNFLKSCSEINSFGKLGGHILKMNIQTDIETDVWDMNSFN